ncbi:class I SAM-dependent methyltransferase [Enterococcus sp. BWM-S5]|uniref:Class I SAM-dependent methyltransferase n=1 Tax=Enterococcus larvae TaxID=2794352 RepID=A0ABS4CI33_9ENTE|nr:class I SAM-dependent methyltransferase [Enterococcus larvae]MBP1045848.1 class I SAM-dependent methyltransferase [Enterococcus larvae]
MNKFEMMAKRYDTPDRLKIATIIADEIRKTISPYHYQTALDFGCGTGLVGLQLKDLFQQMIFTDPSAGMIEQVDQKIAKQDIHNITTLHADLLADSRSDIQVDCIYMSQVLLHIPNTEQVFKGLKPLIKSGGRLVIVDFDQTPSIQSTEIHTGFSHAELTSLAGAAGYTDIAIKTFYHGENLLMNQDSSLFIMEAKI